MPRDPLEEQRLLDRVLYDVFQKLISDSEFSRLIDESCLKIAGYSTPALRATVKLAFQNKVGL